MMLRRYLPTPGSLAANTVLATFWQLMRVAVQLAWTVIVARMLGIDDYGRLAGIVGFAALLATFSGIGFALLMYQEVSRDRALLAASWRKAWTGVLVLGATASLLFAAIGPLVLGSHWPVYLLLGVTELVCVPLAMACSYAFQAHARMGMANLLYVFLPMANLLAGITFAAVSPTRDLPHYAPFHAFFALIAAAAACVVVVRVLQPGRAPFELSRYDAKEAAGFSVMRLADNGLNMFDKTLVLRLAGAEVAGAYTAAFRVVTVLALPISSLAMSALPRLFRAHHGAQDTSSFVTRLLVHTVGYGLLAAAAIWVAAPVLPWLLGPSFAPAVDAARWMSASPLLLGLCTTGSGILLTRQGRNRRIVAQVAGMAAMIVAGITLMPRYGLEGAAITLLVAQAVTAVLAWHAVLSKPH